MGINNFGGTRQVPTEGILDAAVTTAKVAGAAITGAKHSPTGFKSGSFTGSNGAGACTLTGAAIGDRVLAIQRTDASATAVGQQASFEATITAPNAIQQTDVGNLSAQRFNVILIAASA